MTENREDYNPPVADLLTLGDIRQVAADYDYLTHGFTTAHIPELQRMALDEELHWAESEGPHVWAPIHAVRALGQLGDPAGVAGLIAALHQMEEWEDDWSIDELPNALGQIGAPAIEPLQTVLRNRATYFYARVAAAEGLSKVAIYHPAERARVIEILGQQLQDFAGEEEEFNAFIVGSLINIKAVEAAPIIEQAFAADKVEWSIQGDWEEVQIALGLLTERITPAPARWNDLNRYFGELGQGQTQEKRVNPFAAAQKAIDAKLKKQRHAKKLAKQTKQKQRAQKKKKRK